MKKYSYSDAMEARTQEKADEILEQLVQWHMNDNGDSREKAEKIQRTNLGYFAGYYSNETRERVERLFRCVHPIFGSIAENGVPTPEEAFEAGKILGSKK